MIDLSFPEKLDSKIINLYKEKNVKVVRDKLKIILKNDSYKKYLEILFSVTFYLKIPHKSFMVFSGFQHGNGEYLFKRFLYYSLTHQHRLAKKYFSSLTDEYYALIKLLSNSYVKDFFLNEISYNRLTLFKKEKLFYEMLNLSPIITDDYVVKFKKWRGAKTEGIAFPVYRLKSTNRHLDFSNIKMFKKTDGVVKINFSNKVLTKYLKKYFSLSMNVYFVFLLNREEDITIITPLFFSRRKDDFELFVKGEGEYENLIQFPDFSLPEGFLFSKLESELKYSPEDLFLSPQDYLFGVLCYNKQGIYKIYPNSEIIFQEPYKIKNGSAYWKYKHFSGKRQIPKDLENKEIKIRIVAYYINGELVFSKSTNVVEDVASCAICSQNKNNSIYKICMNCCKALQDIFNGDKQAKQTFYPALENGSYHIYCSPIKKHLKLNISGEYIEVLEGDEEDIEILPSLIAPTVVS